MRYEVVYDKGTRLRVRCGKYAFTENEGYGIAEFLLKKDCIREIITSHRNGSILIEYEGLGNRNHILNSIKKIQRKDVREGKPTENDIVRKTETVFQLSLVKKIFERVIVSLVVPYPIRKVMVVYKALPYIKEGLKSLMKLKMNVSLLDAIAIVASIYMRSYDSAGSLIFLLSITEILEEYTIQKTKNSLETSLSINIDTVWLVTDDNEEVSVPLSSIVKGDKIKVRTGGIIPIDGTIINGDAMINESSITGEPLSIHKDEGKTVHGGTVVEEGSIIVEVKAVDEETRINKIIEMIERSESLKAGVQSKAEKLADSMVPFSLLTTAITYLLTRNPMKALSVLMVDYSCAIILSTFISVISAMEEASNHKIMIKGGKYIEAYGEADTIVFDKTGTLTIASPRVAKVVPCGKLSRTEVLRTSACLEEHFAHSVARAIVKQSEIENLHHAEEHSEVEYIVAHGISTTFNGEKTLIGSKHFIFDDKNVNITEKQKKIIEEETSEYSTIYLAIGGELEGIICIEDPIRPEAKEVIDELKLLGIKNVIMLTGDSENAACSVSKQLGITEYRSEVLPEDKAKIIEEIKENGGCVIMVGDGINDSPALSAANVSVAMKSSSDIAKEVSDITLLSEDLYGLITIRLLSQRMLSKINRNYQAIVAINTSLIILGLFGLISPSKSSFIHNFSTVAIGGLSTRDCLDKRKPKKEAPYGLIGSSL